MGDWYEGREQTEAKHEILRRYLERFAYIILNSVGKLDYVDAFCGPWDERDVKDFSDTSFGIALSTLEEVQATLAGMGRTTSVRCVFNESEFAAYQRLDAFVRNRETTSGLQAHCLHGTLEDNAASINEIATNTYRLIFIDPTGWTGFGPASLAPMATGRSEVLINFMYDHINRFVARDAGQRAKWLCDLVGHDRAARLLVGGGFGAAEIEAELKAYLKDDLHYRFVASSPVYKPASDRLHFKLIYASNHHRGVELLREVEFKALSTYDQKRYGKRQDEAQGDMFADTPVEGPYLREHRQHLADLPAAIMFCLPSRQHAPTFKNLCAAIQCDHYVRKTQVKDAVVRLAIEGKIDASWKDRNRNAKKPSDDDVIRQTKGGA